METFMDGLREHMRMHLTASIVHAENVVNFQRDAPNSSENESIAALNLVDQAADMIKGIQHHARHIEAYARNFIDHALDRLELAERRIKSMETEQQAAEAN